MYERAFKITKLKKLANLQCNTMISLTIMNININTVRFPL